MLMLDLSVNFLYTAMTLLEVAALLFRGTEIFFLQISLCGHALYCSDLSKMLGRWDTAEGKSFDGPAVSLNDIVLGNMPV